MGLGGLRFRNGEILKASSFNALRQYIDQVARRYEVPINVTDCFEDGAVLRADQLNVLRDNIDCIFWKVRGHHIEWSFPPFKDGQVLKAEHLNECVEKLGVLERD